VCERACMSQGRADRAAAAKVQLTSLCSAEVDLWMVGCLVAELLLGVPLIHVDAQELWQVSSIPLC
jgi:hypothetical protein